MDNIRIFVYIRILWRLSAFCGNIHVPWILSSLILFYLSHFTHIVKVTGTVEVWEGGSGAADMMGF